MSTPGHERTYRNKWLDAGVYVVSIVLSCVFVMHFLPRDNRVSGGRVAFMILIFALIFRFVFWIILGRVIEKHEDQRRNENHVA